MKNDNNSAFPYVIEDSNFVEGVSSSGMTLRDYFAAKAMQGMAANRNSYIYTDIAIEAYKTADAMIEARKD